MNQKSKRIKIWHEHGRPLIYVGTPPHVHAHADGDDVEHSHHGLSEVVMVGRWPK